MKVKIVEEENHSDVSESSESIANDQIGPYLSSVFVEKLLNSLLTWKLNK